MTILMKAGILTASDRSYLGQREDGSGLLLKSFVQDLPAEVALYQVLPDEKEKIQEMLLRMVNDFHCDVIFTTGGTGLAPRDVTPEATREILEREIPGIAEALRARGIKEKPTAMLSRGLAGVRAKTLIINLPGSPKAVEDSFLVLRPILVHAVQLIQGKVSDCWNLSLLPYSHS